MWDHCHHYSLSIKLYQHQHPLPGWGQLAEGDVAPVGADGEEDRTLCRGRGGGGGGYLLIPILAILRSTFVFINVGRIDNSVACVFESDNEKNRILCW